jgi:aspartyl protease family protein
MKPAHLICLLTLLCTHLLSPMVQADVVVKGLFKGAVLLVVDGQQKLLKQGQEFQGITLLEADSQRAIAEINGQQQILLISTHITTQYLEPVATAVRIPKNQHRQYITTALINGHSTPVLIDTGANVVALNASTARRWGLDYKKGRVHKVQTASGIVTGYQVHLDKVDVGGLVVSHVEASVLEGSQPETVLLGTSYLQHVQMSEKDGVLMLLRKF